MYKLCVVPFTSVKVKSGAIDPSGNCADVDSVKKLISVNKSSLSVFMIVCFGDKYKLI